MGIKPRALESTLLVYCSLCLEKRMPAWLPASFRFRKSSKLNQRWKRTGVQKLGNLWSLTQLKAQ
jgi:hypothetical protein